MGKGKRIRQQRASPPSAAVPGGDEVGEVAYDGPPLSLWRAAWLYAEVVAAHLPVKGRHHADEVTALLARAISVEADTEGLLPSGLSAPLDTPAVLGAVSLPVVGVRRLHEVSSLFEFVKDVGAQPAPDEPGYPAYRKLYGLIWQDGMTSEQVLANPALHERLDDALAEWNANLKLALAAITGAIFSVAGDDDTDVTLARLGHQVNQLLAGRA